MAMTAMMLRPSLLHQLSRFRPRTSDVYIGVCSILPASSWMGRLGELGLGQSVGSLLDSLLMAVPKKKTTHSKKRKRMTHKYLRGDESMIPCDTCERWKRPHTYCSFNCPGRRSMIV